MKKLHVALCTLFFVGISPACSKDSTDAAPKPVVDAAVAVVDAGPTAPQIHLDLTNPSPHAWAASGDLLPAISDDGVSVAILVQKEDGTRMYSNAALEVHNVADDKITTSIPILVADDVVAAEGMPDAFHTTLPAYKTQAKAKLDDANALLGKTKWTPLIDRNGSPPQGDAGTSAVSTGHYQALLTQTGKGLALSVSSSTNIDTGATFQDVSSMLIAPRKTPKPQKGNPMCRFTPYIGELAASSKVAVVRIAQSVVGNVWSCFEPSQWHVYPMNVGTLAPAPSSAPSK